MPSMVRVSPEAWPGTELSGEHAAAIALGRDLDWGQGTLLCVCWEIHKMPGGPYVS